MMKATSRGDKHSISGAFIFLLIGMFAVFSLLLVLIGVGSYQGAVRDAQSNAQVRTSLNYITNKVRAADAQGAVTVENWHGIPTLLCKQWLDGSPYDTRIYFMPNEGGKDGAIYEQFTYRNDDVWGQEYGTRIVDVTSLQISQTGDLISLKLVTLNGQTYPLHLRLRAMAQ